jgi:uncharacterized protein (DUF433 family)
MGDSDLRTREAGAEPIEWEDFIEADPNVLAGNAVVAGTRIAVDHVLSLLATGWTESQVLEAYPGLSREALRAIYAFGAEVVSEQRLFGVPLPARKASFSVASIQI